MGIIAGILSLLAYPFYIFFALKRGMHPNRATWFIWTLVGILLAGSYYSSGARGTMWLPLAYIVGPLATAIVSLKFGEGGWTPFDRKCLLGAFVSGALWLTTGEPLVALLSNLVLDFFGALPTIRKSLLDPRSESRTAWTLWEIGNIANFLAIDKWEFAIVVYPAYMVLMNGAIAVLVWRRNSTGGSKPPGTSPLGAVEQSFRVR